MPNCLRFRECAFFQTNGFADSELFERLSRQYCRGPYLEQCVRKLYKQIHSSDPPANMTPEGLAVGPPKSSVD